MSRPRGVGSKSGYSSERLLRSTPAKPVSWCSDPLLYFGQLPRTTTMRESGCSGVRDNS
jgi:hypothetical protein